MSTVARVTLAARTGPLVGRHVELVPMARGLVDELVAAANVDRSSYGFTEVPATREEMATHVSWLLDLARRDEAIPFAQRLTESGRVVGCTRFMELRRWRGRTEPDEVEIGGTWLASDVQRTAVNTEAKLLLLTHAFDVWNVDRVALATDERNARSRAAIGRLGATFEGVLRNHRPSRAPGEIGTARNTALFSITAGEWPGVRATLTERLAQAG
jgi:RimJ/RimL family protein N-acetyltransferase